MKHALKKKGLKPATLTDEERDEDDVSEVSGKTTRNVRRRQRLKDAEARADDLEGENTMLRHTLKHVRDHAAKGGLLGKHGFEKGGLSLARYLCHVLWHIMVNGVDLEAHSVFMKIVYKQ